MVAWNFYFLELKADKLKDVSSQILCYFHSGDKISVNIHQFVESTTGPDRETSRSWHQTQNRIEVRFLLWCHHTGSPAEFFGVSLDLQGWVKGLLYSLFQMRRQGQVPCTCTCTYMGRDKCTIPTPCSDCPNRRVPPWRMMEREGRTQGSWEQDISLSHRHEGIWQ